MNSSGLAVLRRGATDALPTVVALAGTILVYGVFLACIGADPAAVYAAMWRGAFGTWFSIESTLARAAPLMLVALCTAIPAACGLVVIGGEGALIIGGLSAAMTGLALAGTPAVIGIPAMALAGMAGGALLIGAAGALRHFRGVNETISSLLISYLAIAVFNHLVRGPLRDPKTFNYPGTFPLPRELKIGTLPGIDVHWGLMVGVLACVACWVLLKYTTFGFAARFAGHGLRAAQLGGLNVARITLVLCLLGGAAAGLAGMIEVAAVIGRANGALNVGYGFSAVLVAFVARQHPLGVLPAALLVGGIRASSGLVQRDFQLPDATVMVFEGLLFLAILAAESLRGRWPRPLRVTSADDR